MTTETILRLEEGKELKLYPDSKGILTIGIGYNIEKRGLPDDIVEELFRRDIADLRRAAAAVPEFTALDPVRKGVIERMVFQMGTAGVLAFKAMRAALSAKDWANAKHHMLDSEWARKDSPARAAREAQRILTGVE